MCAIYQVAETVSSGSAGISLVFGVLSSLCGWRGMKNRDSAGLVVGQACNRRTLKAQWTGGEFSS